MNDITVGTIVTHPHRPEWGPGKVVKISGPNVWVFWRDLSDGYAKKMVTSIVALQAASAQRDEVLDNVPPLVEIDGTPTLPKPRMGFREALQDFKSRFPLGFEDPKYIGKKGEKGGERIYKVEAHEKFQRLLGGGKYQELLHNDQDALSDAIIACEAELNVLSIFEKAAFRDALRDPNAAKPFLTALGDVVASKEASESVFEPYFDALSNLPAERGRVATWPVATIIPSLAQPTRYLFFKPEVTRNAADALSFNLHYQSRPNWLTYSRLLEMGRIYKDKLASLKCRDMIDVQSFFYVTCGGYKRLGI